MPTLTDPVLVLVDLQARFCSAAFDYLDAEGEAEMTATVEATNGFLTRYRAAGRTPVFVRTHHDETTNSPVWARKYAGGPVPCRPGSAGAAFVEGLDVRPADQVVTKHRYDAFYGTPLDTLLSANGVTRLLVGGVATHVCVESTVRSAVDRDYAVTVLADCTASADPALKADALARIDGQFGAVAASTDVVLEPVDDPGHPESSRLE